MTIELKDNMTELKDIVHILNAFSQSELVKDKIKDFTRDIIDIRERALKGLQDKKQLEEEIINMYQNDNYSAGKIAEIFNLEKEEIVNILADNEIFCYDYDLEEEDKAIDEIIEKTKQIISNHNGFFPYI